MKKFKDGEYEVPYETEFDRGYGVESATDEIVIEIYNGEFIGATAYGMHFISERECEWEVNITDDEAYALIEKVGA